MTPLIDLQQQISADEKDPSMDADNKDFIEARVSQVEFDVESLNKEREMLEVINQDVDRTMQEYELYT